MRTHPALKDAVIFKISDRFTAGIPDFVVVLNNKTTWFEVKVGKNTTTALQAEFLRRLGECARVILATSPECSVVYCPLTAPKDDVYIGRFCDLVTYIASLCS